jgi:hypothetical protein
VVGTGSGRKSPFWGRGRDRDTPPKTRNSLIAIGLVVLFFAVLIVWAALN